MDKSLYVAMTGARENMLAQRVHANNLANVNTTGFKRDFAVARSMPVFGEHFPSRAYAMTERPGTDTVSGSLIQTGRTMDVAINGDGWFAVQAPDGSEVYTRSGDFQADVNGILRTGTGLPVLGNGGPIAIPPAAEMMIGTDGTISIVPLGGPRGQLAEVDRIKLVNPALDNVQKGTDGLMRSRDGSRFAVDDEVRVTSGFLEASNVNAVESLIETLSLSRQFELQVKLMGKIDENSQAAARILQDS